MHSTTARRAPERSRHRLADGSQLAAGLVIGWFSILALHRFAGRVPIAWSDPVGWLRWTPIEDVLVEVMRHLALGLSYWFVVSTTLYLLAVASRVPGAVRAVEWATLPAIRRLARSAAAVTLATSMTAPSAFLLMPAPPVAAGSHTAPTGPDPEAVAVVVIDDGGVIVPPGYGEPTTEPTYRPTVSETVPSPAGAGGSVNDRDRVVAPPSVPLDASTTDRASVAGADQASADVHLVDKGDHLWSIAAERVAAELGRAPSVAEITPYWLQVVDANRGSIRSGDPDLIYPGEAIAVPPRSEP